MPVCFDESLVTELVLQVDSQGLDAIRSRVSCRDAGQITEDVENSPLIRRLFEALTSI